VVIPLNWEMMKEWWESISTVKRVGCLELATALKRTEKNKKT